MCEWVCMQSSSSPDFHTNGSIENDWASSQLVLNAMHNLQTSLSYIRKVLNMN